MATRALIGMQVKNGIKSMYCHWDGYPTGAGRTLLDHYPNLAKVAALIKLGHVSRLGSNPVLAEKSEDGEACTSAHTELTWTLHAGAGLADMWDEADQEYEYLYTRQCVWLVRISDGGRSASEWRVLLPGSTQEGCFGSAAMDDKTLSCNPHKKPTCDPDSFMGLFARFGDLPASKRDKVLPALKALLEMVEG